MIKVGITNRTNRTIIKLMPSPSARRRQLVIQVKATCKILDGEGRGRRLRDSPNTLLRATRLSLSLACALDAILWEWRNHKIDIKKKFPI